MKRVAFLFFFIVSFSHGFCQTKYDVSVDTLSNVNLVDGQGVSYKIFQLIDLQDNLWIDSTRKLVVFYDTNKNMQSAPPLKAGSPTEGARDWTTAAQSC